MVNTSSNKISKKRQSYFSRSYQHEVFSALSGFFAHEAEHNGVTQKYIADRLDRDPSQVHRWLAHPSNMTLETLSLILLALDAQPKAPGIVKFSDEKLRNFAHPLIADILHDQDLLGAPQQSLGEIPETVTELDRNVPKTTANNAIGIFENA